MTICNTSGQSLLNAAVIHRTMTTKLRTSKTIPGVEFHCKSTRIPQCLWRPPLVNDCRESGDDRSLHSWGSEDISTCQVRDVMCDLQWTTMSDLMTTGGRWVAFMLAPKWISEELTSKNPFADAPLAWTTLSGILSLSNCAIFSRR